MIPESAERLMQLRDAREAVNAGLWRLRLSLLELQAALNRVQAADAVSDDAYLHMSEQRQRVAGMVGHVDDMRDYMGQEEAWT